MAIDITRAMRDGFDRTLARNGLILIGVFAVLGVLNVLTTPSVGPVETGTPEIGPMAVLFGILSILLAIAWLATIVVAVRTFVSAETETIPREFVRRNMGYAVLNVFVGGIVFFTLVALGTLLLVIPGLFLLVSLYYWIVFVAAEDQNAIAGLRSSWRLTKGQRLRLFGLGVAVFVAGLFVSIAFAIPAALVGGVLAMAITQIGSAAFTVYALATTGRAYDQLLAVERIGDVDTRPGTTGTPA